MLSSRLPTGTVRRDDTEGRTYPREKRDRPPSDVDRTAHPPTAGGGVNADGLRAENEALRRQNERLRTRLDTEREDRQAVIDRYEGVVADVEDQSTPRRRQDTPSGPVASLLGRLRGLLSR
ncbi:hypothetical protein SAMN04487949_0062 [Halogranum gelatinilyticum]|uniref:Uncharacterized protein n=1 Tax=Halogranum gelatinilyticum TaxID=660521 RepID=A0A1G9NRI3_9EURY|nr:cell division protein ZapB [Halogranum gelatinilyticum]SDL88647.1 hypothetical protein SAMN04487949_0062 [Halogranum gelatinilyticum]